MTRWRADIRQAPGKTIAALFGLDPKSKGTLVGRVLSEALPGGATPASERLEQVSAPGVGGPRTVPRYQRVGGTAYFDAAGFKGAWRDRGNRDGVGAPLKQLNVRAGTRPPADRRPYSYTDCSALK